MAKRNKSLNTHGFLSEGEVIRHLSSSPVLYSQYQGLNEEWRRHFLDFCEGKKSLPLTYDPFFKRIFHPDIHPDRLSRFISSILGGGALLIMDLLGELEDGALVNIEIQKQGYAFPAERISCYSADLLMRQYARVKGEKGSGFTYRDIKKVYVIVIFEKSTGEFHKVPGRYLHLGKVTFDSGMGMEFLQEYVLIALDIFKKFFYSKDRNEQIAWLSLLATENLEEAEQMTRVYPWLKEIYEEIAMLRQKPEEVLGMYSEALRILDQNTLKYMIEELQKEVEEKDAVLREKDSALRLMEEKNEELMALLEKYKGM